MPNCNDCEHIKCTYSACINGNGFVQKAKPCEDYYTCPNCGTYNEAWNKREKTINGRKEIVYCWHCGCKVQLN